jgi:hypothetical protein
LPNVSDPDPARDLRNLPNAPEQVLDTDQMDTLQMLVPLAERVMGEQNDPLKNDELETVPPETVQHLRFA